MLVRVTFKSESKRVTLTSTVNLYQDDASIYFILGVILLRASGISLSPLGIVGCLPWLTGLSNLVNRPVNLG